MNYLSRSVIDGKDQVGSLLFALQFQLPPARLLDIGRILKQRFLRFLSQLLFCFGYFLDIVGKGGPKFRVSGCEVGRALVAELASFNVQEGVLDGKDMGLLVG